MLKARLLGAVGIVAVIGGVAGVRAQTSVALLPAFEVASVKITPLGHFDISPIGQNRFSIRSVTLTFLISMAFGVNDTQVLQGPGWRDSEYYDVTAKAEDGINLTYDELRPRLQQLLAQRFKLATHPETKGVPGYALVVAKGGPKLKESGAGSAVMAAILPGGLRAPSASIDSLAGMLARPLGRPVVNETGLKGTYEIRLDFAPESAADSPLPSIFTAVEEQFGLRLETRTVPVEMVVIDHVERPTED